MKVTRIHLNARGMCGRGVGVRELTPEQIRRAEEVVAKRHASKPKEERDRETVFELRNQTITEKLKLMVVEVTEPTDDLEKAEWRELEPTEVELHFDSLFPGAKDRALLERLYSYLHEITAEDVDVILGKAKPAER
jgi:hypothetical protein